jgi:hypothetical protein
MADSSLNLARIWRETLTRLESLDVAVQEAKRLDEALDFTRFVFWSGLLQLFKENPQPFPLKVDGPFLEWKCKELQSKVQERYRLNDGAPHIEETQLNAINRKLDIIAGHLQKFSPPVMEPTANVVEPVETALRVLPGGAS